MIERRLRRLLRGHGWRLLWDFRGRGRRRTEFGDVTFVDEVLDDALAGGDALADFTWGAHNTADIRHPMSRSMPLLSAWPSSLPVFLIRCTNPERLTA